jgi:hypothetical protein
MRKLTTTALIALALTACAAPQPESSRSPEQTQADLTGLLMPTTQPQPQAPCLPIEGVMGWNGCPR